MPESSKKGNFKFTLDPADEIKFTGPFDDGAEKKIDFKITNADDGKSRAFKVKCTSNALFRIRPAVGRVEPGKSTTVSITYTPAKDKKVTPADDEHVFSVYHVVADKKDDPPRKTWSEHTGEPEGSCRLTVKFAGGEKKDSSDKEKKDEEKKDEDGKDDKKEEEKKGEKDEKAPEDDPKQDD